MQHFPAAPLRIRLVLVLSAAPWLSGARPYAQEPPASIGVTVHTTLPTARQSALSLAFDGKPETAFSSGRGPDERDHFTVRLSAPWNARRIVVETGREEDGSMKLAEGVLEVSSDGMEFQEAARFESGTARADLPGQPLRAVRIRPTRKEGSGLAIREVTLEPRPAIEKVAQALCISVDTSEVPEVADWGKRARDLCEAWHPKICEILASDGFEPRLTARLLFRKEMRGIANASGSDIRIAAAWIQRHPDDFGMVIHELTHVVQAYRGGNRPGWLVEGIADYVRLFHFEPEAPRPRINPDKASYRDAYKTTAAFLAWIEKHHRAGIVKEMNAALRRGEFEDALWAKLTGHTVDELWKRFADSLRSGATGAPRRMRV